MTAMKTRGWVGLALSQSQLEAPHRTGSIQRPRTDHVRPRNSVVRRSPRGAAPPSPRPERLMTAAACPAVYYVDSACCVTFWQNVAIIESRGLIDVTHMLTFERAYQALAQRFTGGICSCVVVQAGTPLSPPDALRESARFVRELGSALRCIAVVIEDVGIAAQVFRTVIRGINVVTRENKLVVLGDFASAVDVLTPLIVPAAGQRDVSGAVTTVLNSARARFASTPPPAPDPGWPSLRG